jgi:hypothetical protein
VTSISQTPPLVEEETPISKHVKVEEEQKYGHRSPRGSENNNDCADEDQRKFTVLY